MKTPDEIIAKFAEHWVGTTEELAEVLEAFYKDIMDPVRVMLDAEASDAADDYFVNHYGEDNLSL